jgi:hypothetical protein
MWVDNVPCSAPPRLSSRLSVSSGPLSATVPLLFRVLSSAAAALRSPYDVIPIKTKLFTRLNCTVVAYRLRLTTPSFPPFFLARGVVSLTFAPVAF